MSFAPRSDGGSCTGAGGGGGFAVAGFGSFGTYEPVGRGFGGLSIV